MHKSQGKSTVKKAVAFFIPVDKGTRLTRDRRNTKEGPCVSKIRYRNCSSKEVIAASRREHPSQGRRSTYEKRDRNIRSENGRLLKVKSVELDIEGGADYKIERPKVDKRVKSAEHLSRKGKEKVTAGCIPSVAGETLSKKREATDPTYFHYKQSRNTENSAHIMNNLNTQRIKDIGTQNKQNMSGRAATVKKEISKKTEQVRWSCGIAAQMGKDSMGVIKNISTTGNDLSKSKAMRSKGGPDSKAPSKKATVRPSTAGSVPRRRRPGGNLRHKRDVVGEVGSRLGSVDDKSAVRRVSNFRGMTSSSRLTKFLEHPCEDTESVISSSSACSVAPWERPYQAPRTCVRITPLIPEVESEPDIPFSKWDLQGTTFPKRIYIRETVNGGIVDEIVDVRDEKDWAILTYMSPLRPADLRSGLKRNINFKDLKDFEVYCYMCPWKRDKKTSSASSKTSKT
ncbi:uncharacterized protein LOC116603494 [Nematostella vectensis]|uniref:uncharacterized protein LOC116603494 n=1 Tax=Nematostella vectensis TaxID=45351 RepID=UPI0020770541|nr:uncharacterized protein LOC116603494 [Nematostella vectensis]